MAEAAAQGRAFGVAVWSESVRELTEILAVIDTEGEHQEVEFAAQLMQRRRKGGESTV